MSVDRRIVKLLNDIYTSAERISVIIEHETLESFLSPASMTLQDAVARRLTIIGEASAALLRKHPDFCKDHQELPLRKARGLRNFLVHDYDGIDWRLVWVAVSIDLPKLLKSIQAFLKISNSFE